jgi:hypothetical protein
MAVAQHLNPQDAGEVTNLLLSFAARGTQADAERCPVCEGTERKTKRI